VDEALVALPLVAATSTPAAVCDASAAPVVCVAPEVATAAGATSSLEQALTEHSKKTKG
jgi:hypothetical protein